MKKYALLLLLLLLVFSTTSWADEPTPCAVYEELWSCFEFQLPSQCLRSWDCCWLDQWPSCNEWPCQDSCTDECPTPCPIPAPGALFLAGIGASLVAGLRRRQSL